MQMFTRCKCRDCRILVAYEEKVGVPCHVPTLCEDCAKAHCSSAGNADCRVSWGAVGEPKIEVEEAPPMNFSHPNLTISKEGLADALAAQRELYASMGSDAPEAAAFVGMRGRHDIVTEDEAEAINAAVLKVEAEHTEVRIRRFLVGAALFLAAGAGFLIWLCP